MQAEAVKFNLPVYQIFTAKISRVDKQPTLNTACKTCYLQHVRLKPEELHSIPCQNRNRRKSKCQELFSCARSPLQFPAMPRTRVLRQEMNKVNTWLWFSPGLSLLWFAQFHLTFSRYPLRLRIKDPIFLIVSEQIFRLSQSHASDSYCSSDLIFFQNPLSWIPTDP